MKGRSALAMVFAGLLLAPASVAFAQDEEESGEEASSEAASEEGASEESAEGAEGAEATSEESSEEAAPAASGRWPRQVIARPLTLPKGLINVGANIPFTQKFEVIGLGLNFGYGISDDLEVRATYGLTLKEFEAKGTLGFGAGYKILRGAAGGKLELIARANTGYSLLAELLAPLNLGAQVQYNISDKLAVVSPQAGLRISLEEVAGVRPIDLVLPVGVGYQATPELYAQVDTTLATIEVSDSASAFIFADNIPLTASVVYNLQPALDITASFGFTDLKNNAGDNITAAIGAQYYIGAL